MSSNKTLDKIQQQVTENAMMIYMKGTPDAPECGFSGKAIQLLKACGASNVATVNVLEDDSIRQGIKEFSQWPTVPQLYIKGEFIGGSDIMSEMFESGELQKLVDETKA